MVIQKKRPARILTVSPQPLAPETDIGIWEPASEDLYAAVRDPSVASSE
jgi:hypothetical protein